MAWNRTRDAAINHTALCRTWVSSELLRSWNSLGGSLSLTWPPPLHPSHFTLTEHGKGKGIPTDLLSQGLHVIYGTLLSAVENQITDVINGKSQVLVVQRDLAEEGGCTSSPAEAGRAFAEDGGVNCKLSRTTPFICMCSAWYLGVLLSGCSSSVLIQKLWRSGD